MLLQLNTASTVYSIFYLNRNEKPLVKLVYRLTFQNMHPDQLGTLRTTPDLPLQIVLSLTMR